MLIAFRGQGKFLRDAQFAFRLACGFVCAAMIGFRSDYRKEALIGWSKQLIAFFFSSYGFLSPDFPCVPL